MEEKRVIITKDKAKGPFFAGIDVGGTGIKVGIVDDDAQTLSYVTIKTEVEKGPTDATQRMADTVHKAIHEAGLVPSDVVRVGLATPGTMDVPNGILIEPSNLKGWDHFPIRDTLAKFCGIPVTYENDANAAAFGEHWAGSGKNYKSMILLTLGTGVGGGIIINDRTLIGENSHGGECGHNIVNPSKYARMCNCGQRGHLEAYTSATGVSRRTFELLETGISTSLQNRVSVNTMTADDKRKLPKMLHEEALKGDEFSIGMIKDTAHWLAIGIVTLMHTIDPHCVLIGGAMTFGGKGDPVGEMFLQSIKDEVCSRTFKVLASRIVIDFATLGGDAGYLGAAGVAREFYKRGN